MAPTPPQLQAAAAKQARILALQQQAIMHRARIATGRTHSGHVLPAYQLEHVGDEPPPSVPLPGSFGVAGATVGTQSPLAPHGAPRAAPAYVSGYTVAPPAPGPRLHRASLPREDAQLQQQRAYIRDDGPAPAVVTQHLRHEAGLPMAVQHRARPAFGGHAGGHSSAAAAASSANSYSSPVASFVRAHTNSFGSSLQQLSNTRSGHPPSAAPWNSRESPTPPPGALEKAQHLGLGLVGRKAF